MDVVQLISAIEEPEIWRVGGKGYSLVMLTQNGYNVPEGFIINAEAFFTYLRSNGQMEAIEELVSQIDDSNLQQKTLQIRELVLRERISDEIASEIEAGLIRIGAKLVSVRSSAVSEDSSKASFAGLHDTFLNVDAKLEEVLDCVKKCWASLFTDRAVSYRIEKEIAILEGMAVVIQEMIPAEISGISFTAHPNDRQQMLFEFTSGIGDRLVGGAVTPDSCIIGRADMAVTKKHLGTDIGFDDDKLQEIAEVCLSIENLFGAPQDIEWCILENEVYILQSRRITTLTEESKILLRGIGASKGKAVGRCRVIHNIQQIGEVEKREVMVTPMTNPSMVVAMMKCAAIITDHGGMICHAAIISRELGIPCVVGTKEATRVLGNEMVVEVDGTAGIVYGVQEKTPSHHKESDISAETKRTYRIFGNEVEIEIHRMKRNEPFWSENWEMKWPQIDMNEEHEWIRPRPEIANTPFTGSLILQGVERMPYLFGFDDLGPLFSFISDDGYLYVRLDKLRAVVSLFADLIFKRNESFITDFQKRLQESYAQLDESGKMLYTQVQASDLTDGKSVLDLLESFKKWWKTHEDFFALTFLIQAIGDDIVWPYIRSILLKSNNNNEQTTNEQLTTLALPTAAVLSTCFRNDVTRFVDSMPASIKEIVFSNLKISTIFELVQKMDGDSVIEDLHKLTNNWLWMRDRGFYFEPINNEEGMIDFIRRQFPQEGFSEVNLSRNTSILDRGVSDCKRNLDEDSFKDFMFFLSLGRLLHVERDNHHIIWLKNSAPARDLFLKIGGYMKRNGIVDHEKDIFFLTIPEILDLMSHIQRPDKVEEITGRIPERMKRYSLATKVSLH